MYKPRILLGTMEICNQLHVWQNALKSMGYDAYTVVRSANPFYAESRYDEYLDNHRMAEVLQTFQQAPLDTLVSAPDDLNTIRRLLSEFDIYIFQWGYSLVSRLAELGLLRSLGKTVICVFNGSDVRSRDAYRMHCEEYGFPPAPFAIQDPDPTGTLNDKLAILRSAELYADAVIGLPDYMALAIKPYFHFWSALDISAVRHNIPARDNPVIVHAPSRREFKGTPYVLDAVDSLRNEGLEFEFQLLEGVPNTLVLASLVNADIAVDQLYIEYPATFAQEAMASGCAVAGGNRPDSTRLPAGLPVVDVKPDSIRERLRELIVNKSFRVGLAERGREYVLRNHHPLVSASRILETVSRAKQSDFDYRPSLFVDRFVVTDHEPLTEQSRQLNRAVLSNLPETTEDVLAAASERGLI